MNDKSELDHISETILECLNKLADSGVEEENIVFSLMTHTEFRKMMLLDDCRDPGYIEQMMIEAKNEAAEIYNMREGTPK